MYEHTVDCWNICQSSFYCLQLHRFTNACLWERLFANASTHQYVCVCERESVRKWEGGMEGESERETVHVCVCVRERARERERAGEREWEKERERERACVSKCVCVRVLVCASVIVRAVCCSVLQCVAANWSHTYTVWKRVIHLINSQVTFGKKPQNVGLFCKRDLRNQGTSLDYTPIVYTLLTTNSFTAHPSPPLLHTPLLHTPTHIGPGVSLCDTPVCDTLLLHTFVWHTILLHTLPHTLLHLSQIVIRARSVMQIKHRWYAGLFTQKKKWVGKNTLAQNNHKSQYEQIYMDIFVYR